MHDIIAPYVSSKSRTVDARSKFAKITPKCGQLFMQAYAKIAQDAATMDPPLLGPDPEIVLKLGNLYEEFIFLKLSNFFCSDISLIFLF